MHLQGNNLWFIIYYSLPILRPSIPPPPAQHPMWKADILLMLSHYFQNFKRFYWSFGALVTIYILLSLCNDFLGSYRETISVNVGLRHDQEIKTENQIE